MERIQDFLFIAYLLRKRGREFDVCYQGCREIAIPDYKTPTHIRGMIEFEGILIPVIDPGIFFHQNPASVTNSTCILVVEHIHESRIRRTGIIIENIEEIMNLAAGMYKNGTAEPSTYNIRFVLEMSDTVATEQLLSNTHLAFDLGERQKQADADYAAFQEITSQLTQS
jgi:hypothetical protein